MVNAGLRPYVIHSFDKWCKENYKHSIGWNKMLQLSCSGFNMVNTSELVTLRSEGINKKVKPMTLAKRYIERTHKLHLCDEYVYLPVPHWEGAAIEVYGKTHTDYHMKESEKQYLEQCQKEKQ